MRHALTLLAVTLLPLVFAQAAHAQQQDAVPTPDAYLRDYTLAFTPHHKLVEYFEAVAAASDRVAVAPYGETYEGRPLVLAYISSAANLARLEEIRAAHLAGTGETAVVWLSCSVHGNESSGSEAAPRILYDLATAAGTDSLTGFLENTVVILDPSLNPDGYTRYTDGQARRATLRPDPANGAWEHDEPWPGGRTNHYLFDLNRDWAWATQQETQARLLAYRRWQPHVHADLHEMSPNSSYYFAPAAEPYHAYITDFQRDFQRDIGRNHARIFDANGWLYYTGQVFDLLYPSYGDTYPTFNGAVGMTYEQAGSGRASRAFLRGEGDTLTLAARIAHHHATALSTVAVASRNAARLVAATRAFRDAATAGARGLYEGYVFPAADNSPRRLRALTTLLDRHDIAYGTLGSATTLRGTAYAPGAGEDDLRASPGDLVVPGRQAQGVLAQVLLDPNTTLADSLTYDITAWSLPTILGLRGFATAVELPASLDPYVPAEPQTAAEAPAYGFGVLVDGLSAWSAIAPQLQLGAVARYSGLDTRLDGRTVPAGTLWVLARDQPGEDAYAKTYARLRTAGLTLVPLASGFADGAGLDLGSDGVARIDAPTVVLLQDDAVDPNAFGHVWHFFERRLGYPIRPVPWGSLDARALEDVDVVIATDARLDVDAGGADALTAWVRGGGRLIAMEGAAEVFGALDGFGLKVEAGDSAALKTGAGDDEELLRPYAERERDQINENITGALVATQVDTTHPVAYGLGRDFFALRTAERPWAYLEEGYNVIVVRDDAEVRGFIGRDARRGLGETLTVGVQPMGRGSVVYVADNLAYRGFWEEGMVVLANAVFYR